MYIVQLCTKYSYVQSTVMYKVHLCTKYSYVQSTVMYTVQLCTKYSYTLNDFITFLRKIMPWCFTIVSEKYWGKYHRFPI